MAFIRELTQQDLLDAQANYSGAIEVERDRYCYLNMYMVIMINVKAMVDLLNQYQQQGSISSRELPDYLPTYIEYLTLCLPMKVLKGLILPLFWHC